jgi:hypothetical protein
LAALLLGASALCPAQTSFDQHHASWGALLQQAVVVEPAGHASRLRYAQLQQQRAVLGRYLRNLSEGAPLEFDAWSGQQQLVFLINAYNAFTVERVLSRYPDLSSFKDLGQVLQNPWKEKFFGLLGQERSLDELEHGLIRAPGAFDDPRIHFALVCASVGCPMLRNEAYTADRLDAQLDDAMRRFLSDRARNRFDPATRTLAVSKLFDWYRKDFELGHHGFGTLASVFARYADALADDPVAQAQIRSGRYSIAYLPYDWSLNDAK